MNMEPKHFQEEPRREENHSQEIGHCPEGHHSQEKDPRTEALSKDAEGGLQGTSRQEEEAFLEQTLAVVNANLENYGAQVSRMREEIDDMLDHFHDDNPELINLTSMMSCWKRRSVFTLVRGEFSKTLPTRP